MFGKRLRRSIGCLPLIIALSLGAALAQGEANNETPTAVEGFTESTSLWKVETDTGTVYLMGSIHLLKQSDYPLHPKMTEAFDRAGTLVLELEMDSTVTPEFQQYILAKAVYDSGKTLQMELGDSVFSLLGTQMDSLGLDIAQVGQFEPWMVAITFLSLKLQQLGFKPDLGVDLHFYEAAKARGLKIRALEEPREQIDLLDSLPAPAQRALVLQMMAQASDIEAELDEIVQNWKTGDLQGLEATMNKSLGTFPEIREVLLARRNRNWIPKIETYIDSRGIHLIIVGAAHMAGEDGVIALLRQAGYEVEQM